MFRVADIFSLSDFQRRTREHIRRLRETGRPEVLTVNGRAELVVYAAETYEAIVGEAQSTRTRPIWTAAESIDVDSDKVIELYQKGVDRTLLRENLRRTVQERVDNLLALQRLASEARRAGEAAR
jgi:PHD/YefM family antitoxin component YafN of YafNO toxin-antitoxin module